MATTTCKLTKLDHGIVMSSPTDRVRVIFDNRNHPTQKEILYVGFHDFQTAQKCYRYLVDKGYVTQYDRATDRGICKPRRSERVETCQGELKIHRPDVSLVTLFVDKSRALEVQPLEESLPSVEVPQLPDVEVKPIAVASPKVAKRPVPVRSTKDPVQWEDPYADDPRPTLVQLYRSLRWLKTRGLIQPRTNIILLR